MLSHLLARQAATAVPLVPLSKARLEPWLKKQSKATRTWVGQVGFRAEPGQWCPLPAKDGSIERMLIGVGGPRPWDYAGLARQLPEGHYFVDAKLGPQEADDAALGWALGCYDFSRYRKPRKRKTTLTWPAGTNRKRVARLTRGIGLVRDLVNTPACDMGPAELAAAARRLAKRHQAKCAVVQGDKLREGYPAIFAVGHGSDRAPRLVDIRWGKASHPKVTLVGKGVCFDSGGLDLKPASGMKLMKKDMGGAALALGLADAVMDAKLKVRLRVLVPSVENSVSGRALRPLDVIRTRKGVTVEVGNTDAEGRLVLCDALAEAEREHPALIVDTATLTGAARVALGTDLPVLFSNDEEAAAATLSAGVDEADRLWRLPLHDGYRSMLDSSVADINNISSSRYGGAITAALFLREFVGEAPWIHVDTMGWNVESRPGRPRGGEALGLRALYTMLERRFG